MTAQPITVSLLGEPVASFGYVYRIANIKTGAAYIGVTTRHPSARWASHISTAKHSPLHLIHRALARHGVRAFRFEVIATADDKASLARLEQELIVSLKTHVRDGGYNLTGGGDGAYDVSDETRERMRAARKALWQDPEFVERVIGPQRGRKLSPEHVQRLIDIQTGRPLSKTHRETLSRIAKGRIISPEQRAKISRSLTGRKADPAAVKARADAMRGRSPSDETRKKLTEGQLRRWAKWREERGNV
jgi:group I intron endonuclease